MEADTVRAGPGADVVQALDGNDEVNGGLGDDTIYLGDSRDLRRSDGDHAFGGEGNGQDTIYGQAGPEYMDAGAGNDVVRGGFGKDYLYGASGDDVLVGGPGPDGLEGGDGNDRMWGGDGADEIQFVLPGRDWIFMGSGPDQIWVGLPDGGHDYLNCGAGRTDQIVFVRRLDPLDKYVNCERFDPASVVTRSAAP